MGQGAPHGVSYVGCVGFCRFDTPKKKGSNRAATTPPAMLGPSLPTYIMHDDGIFLTRATFNGVPGLLDAYLLEYRDSCAFLLNPCVAEEQVQYRGGAGGVKRHVSVSRRAHTAGGTYV